ncbi:hypothetical protein C8J57DRAFT_1251779 [Mycena rebaudengoi]|nr:hypothetical protein C8J57DRAFT_1251779 [Mycena rebaudengoi]
MATLNSLESQRNQQELAEKACLRMAKYRQRIKGDPVAHQEHTARAQEAKRVYNKRHATTNAITQRIRRANKRYKGQSNAHQRKAADTAAAPRDYEEEVVLYMEIRGDEKWQKSRWGKAAMEKAGDGY